MAVASQARKIDELASRAAEVLAAKGYFEAESLASRALALARSEQDFRRMAAIATTLERARLARLGLAIAAKKITIIKAPFADDVPIAPGCYLFQPPVVGADARRFRLLALGRQIPAAILCREPVIRMGLVPIVAIAPNATVRTKVRPPSNLERPGQEWFRDALEALGDAAAEMDPELDVEKRIDTLLARLEAVPEHEGLHRRLEETCHEAAETRPVGPAPQGAS